jgi:hypothetical protein
LRQADARITVGVMKPALPNVIVGSTPKMVAPT